MKLTMYICTSRFSSHRGERLLTGCTRRFGRPPRNTIIILHQTTRAGFVVVIGGRTAGLFFWRIVIRRLVLPVRASIGAGFAIVNARTGSNKGRWGWIGCVCWQHGSSDWGRNQATGCYRCRGRGRGETWTWWERGRRRYWRLFLGRLTIIGIRTRGSETKTN